ncbi:Nudix family hydrolase [Lysobacter enzymogenes]|nr:Nudix family hydrolase [Lysobacter enzymogenes]
MGSWADTAATRDSGFGVGESADADPEPPAAVASAVAESPAPRSSARRIEVVAGVIRDARGRVLLTRRTEGRDLAGLWEFPGGKREPGETPEAALSRELHEELGIDAEIGAEVIRVPQIYPDKRLVLDVRHVRAWRGSARGREGQALAWVPPHKLASYAMPPADRPVVAALEQPERYLVTPEPEDVGVWLAGLSAALAAGVRRVQLRAPALAAGDRARWRQLAAAAAKRCRAAKAELLVNADLELALELGLGLHLRAAQLRELGERPLAAGLPLAASCHDADELRAAQALGCDFAVVGSVKPTPSHPSVLGIGWEAFAALRESVSLPIYAIGGLGPDDLAEARRHGAQGVAAIRSLWPG